MKNSLPSLTRIQKFKIDEQRKLLSEQLELEEKIINNIKMLDAKYNEEKAFALKNPLIGDFGIYTKRYLELRQREQDNLQAVRHRIEEIKDIIADMFKEQKTYEIVDDHRRKKAQQEADHKEQNMLDEIGTNAYIKQHDNNHEGEKNV